MKFCIHGCDSGAVRGTLLGIPLDLETTLGEAVCEAKCREQPFPGSGGPFSEQVIYWRQRRGSNRQPGLCQGAKLP